MKQVNFSHPGGFPLEQETLERLQTAYRSELYEAIKSHLSIVPNTNYIIVHAQSGKQGWAVIHQDGEGILYPITGTVTNYLKTTRTTTNLIYGDGASQTAYIDYKAEYVSAKGTPITNDKETVNYYDLNTFKTVKSIQAIEEIIAGIDGRIKTIEAAIPVIDNRVKTIETTLPTIDTRINTIKNDLESYLPLDGSKAMKGDLNLGTHQLYLNNANTSSNGSLLVLDNSNKVVKSNTMIEKLIERIETLEGKSSTPSIPIGMIALWGQSAPFPEGWEEYVPLRGRMPVGLDTAQSYFNSIDKTGGNKDAVLVAHSHIITNSGNVNNGESGGEVTNKIARWDRGYGSYLNGTVSTEGVSAEGKNLPPYKVVYFIVYTGKTTVVDSTPPTIPTNLTVSNIGTTSLTLKWNASTDNIGVTGYLVYKNNSNTPFDELGKDVLTYNVTGLSANTSYSFQIRAKDLAGNLSAPSSVNAVTKAADVTAPTVPSYLHCVHNGQGYIQVEWSPSEDDDSPIDYELSRSVYGSLFTVLKKNPDTFYNEKVSTNGTYTYRVQAIDPSGNASAYKEASITISSL